MTPQELSSILLQKNAVKVSIDPSFTWTSGMKSPVYCDNRLMLSHPNERSLIIDETVNLIRGFDKQPDFIAGTATAGIGWAALVADRMQLPMVYIRHKSKDYGAGKNIEGAYVEGSHAVVVEDLFSTGGSAVRSVNTLRDEGKCTVTDVTAIFTYGFPKASKAAEDAKVTFHPLTDFATLLEVAKGEGTLSEQDIEIALKFSQDPTNWNAS